MWDLTAGRKQRYSEDSCCDRHRCWSTSLAFSGACPGGSGTPPGWFWCCVGCSSARHCRGRSSGVCTSAHSCSSCTRSERLSPTSSFGYISSLSKRDMKRQSTYHCIRQHLTTDMQRYRSVLKFEFLVFIHSTARRLRNCFSSFLQVTSARSTLWHQHVTGPIMKDK